MNYNKLDCNIVIKINPFKYKICGNLILIFIVSITKKAVLEHKCKVNRFHI